MTRNRTEDADEDVCEQISMRVAGIALDDLSVRLSDIGNPEEVGSHWSPRILRNIWKRERIEAQRGISISTTRYPNFFVSLEYFSTSTFSRVHPQDYFRSYFQLNSIHRSFL